MADSSLSGRRIVITGAGRGLGRAIAIVAAQQGAGVVLVGRDPAKLQRVAGEVRSATSRSPETITCDLAEADSIRAACAKILQTNRVVDVLINNGAPWLEGSLSETSDSEITESVAAAVTGTILFTKGLLPGIRRSPAADIVTIVSTAGYLGWAVRGASVAFHAAKHGQSGFSDRLRHELKEEGIRVSAIYPPDFDDLDPLDSRWSGDGEPAGETRLTNREIVSTVLFTISAPRACSYPVIIVEGMS
jgi:short-subunit dehydrogenase